MKRKIFSALCAFLLTVPAMHAQWVVADPGNLAQGIVNSVNEMVETSETAQNAMSTFKEASGKSMSKAGNTTTCSRA